MESDDAAQRSWCKINRMMDDINQRLLKKMKKNWELSGKVAALRERVTENAAQAAVIIALKDQVKKQAAENSAMKEQLAAATENAAMQKQLAAAIMKGKLLRAMAAVFCVAFGCLFVLVCMHSFTGRLGQVGTRLPLKPPDPPATRRQMIPVNNMRDRVSPDQPEAPAYQQPGSTQPFLRTSERLHATPAPSTSKAPGLSHAPPGGYAPRSSPVPPQCSVCPAHLRVATCPAAPHYLCSAQPDLCSSELPHKKQRRSTSASYLPSFPYLRNRASSPLKLSSALTLFMFNK